MDIQEILSTLGIKGMAQRVYLALIELGSSPAQLISRHAEIPKSTIYDALNELKNAGLVIQSEEDNKTIFSIAEPERLAQLHQEKINLLTKSKNALNAIIPDLMKQRQTIKPQIKFFNGKDGIRRALSDILWSKNIDTYTMWPMQQMLETVGYDFLEFHNQERTKHNIGLKSLREFTDKKIDFTKYPLLEAKEDTLREVRYAPEAMDWKMSFWLYGDKTLFATSGNELFAFIVHSREFNQMMHLLWKSIWDVSGE